MTRMLVRVADAAEAALAATAGVDMVDLDLAGTGDADLAVARAVRLAFPGRLRLRLDGLSLSIDLVRAAAAVGADELALALDTSPPSLPVVDAARPPSLAAVALLAVAPDTREAIQRVRPRVDAVMIESGRFERLFDRAGIAVLSGLADSCRSSGLPFGFSGGLEAPDVARLLLLRPDVLGFDTAVRGAHKADGRLLPHLLDAIRALIPRDGAAATPRMRAAPPVADRIFVRDFVVPLSIGAYRAEQGGRQRVRFSVEAEVSREPGPPRDMRDVFSYDIIIETIRVLADRPHVTFVETLAEEIAAALLGHADLDAIRVKVEKLDIVDGSVGIEIERRRSDAR